MLLTPLWHKFDAGVKWYGSFMLGFKSTSDIQTCRFVYFNFLYKLHDLFLYLLFLLYLHITKKPHEGCTHLFKHTCKIDLCL